MTSIRVESRVLAALLLALAGATVLVTCGRTVTPREGWDEGWGPLVPHRNFPGDCGVCHIPERWDVLREDFTFDHGKETGYELEGAHEGAACLRCHNDFGPVRAYVARGCAGCHADVHRQQLGNDCEQCHDQTSWRPEGLIAEHARTRFPLFGAHAAVACELCHTGAPTGDYRDAPVDCELCHAADLARASSPDHRSAGWVTDCERCHRPTTWTGSGFNHGFFPLTGAHAALACTECHVGGDYSGLSADCYACHADDYNGEDSHLQASFPTTCQVCHNTSTWEDARFDHSFFPLTGAHRTLSCLQCHTGGRWQGLPGRCIDCHQDDYNNAPDHVAADFPTECQTCHSTTSWQGAVIDHSFFALSGGHSGVACQQCHVGGQYQGTPTNCDACHLDDYQRQATHVQNNFPRDCSQCHTINRWTGATFNHRFPITGPHDVTCAECHTTGDLRVYSCTVCHERGETDNEHDEVGNYRYVSTACFQCHQNGREND